MKINRYLSILAVAIGLMACEKEIFPELDEPFEVVVIDAWLTNQPGPQNIYITRSQPYFENEFPAKISGANVLVIDSDSVVYPFVENDSAYTWISPDATSFGETGKTFILLVEVEGEQFSAFTTIGRVPEIDSIRFNFDEEIPNFIFEDFYLAEFFATDPQGVGDAYWIKTWKNGQYLNKPNEINIAFDAANSVGASVDGVPFIQPIRQDFLNPLDNDEGDEIPGFPSPYRIGDSVYVEIHSISPEAFFFMTEVIVQINRAGGFGALFAQPVANVSSNIFNLDENSEERAVGFFNVAAVSSMGKTLTAEEAEEAQERFELGL